VEMINVRGQDFNQIFPSLPLINCPKCYGYLREKSNKIFEYAKCGSKYSELDCKNLEQKEGD